MKLLVVEDFQKLVALSGGPTMVKNHQLEEFQNYVLYYSEELEGFLKQHEVPYSRCLFHNLTEEQKKCYTKSLR